MDTVSEQARQARQTVAVSAFRVIRTRQFSYGHEIGVRGTLALHENGVGLVAVRVGPLQCGDLSALVKRQSEVLGIVPSPSWHVALTTRIGGLGFQVAIPLTCQGGLVVEEHCTGVLNPVVDGIALQMWVVLKGIADIGKACALVLLVGSRGRTVSVGPGGLIGPVGTVVELCQPYRTVEKIVERVHVTAVRRPRRIPIGMEGDEIHTVVALLA